MMLLQAKRAKSLQLSQTWNLVNPVSLFKFQLADGISKKGTLCCVKKIERDGYYSGMNYIILFAIRFALSLNVDLEKLRVLGRVYFLFLFLYSGLEYTLTFLTHLRFNYNAAQQGKMLLFIGLLMAFFQGGLVRRVKPGKEKMIALIVRSLF